MFERFNHSIVMLLCKKSKTYHFVIFGRAMQALAPREGGYCSQGVSRNPVMTHNYTTSFTLISEIGAFYDPINSPDCPFNMIVLLTCNP